MVEQTDNNYVSDKEVEIIGIDIEQEKREQKDVVKRIRFKCEDFDITYKPSVLTDEYSDGMTIKGTRQITINEIPQIVKDIGKAIARNKVCRVKVNYGLFNTEDREGDPVTYRYIRYQSQLAKWNIL